MADLNAIDWVAYVLVIVGALNWGLVAISPDYDLVSMIFGGSTAVLARIVYALVGLSGLWVIYTLFK